MIEYDSRKRDEILIKSQEIQQNEQINQYGVMVGSVLTVTLIEARELKSNRLTGNIKPYFIMSIEG